MADWPAPYHYVVGQHEYLTLLVAVETYKNSDLQVAGDLCLHLRCEIWTRNTNLERRTDIFGRTCFRRIKRYLWYDFVTIQRLLHETVSRLITSIVCQRHLRILGMWHTIQKLILLTEFSSKGIAQH